MAAGETPEAISEAGKLPNERFRDAGQIRDYCTQLINDDDKAAKRRRSVDGLYKRYPTYSREWLEERNQGWRARVNHGGLEGACDLIETALFNLDVEVPAVIDVGIDYGKGLEQERIQSVVEREFTLMLLHNWQDCDAHILKRNHELTLHGCGFHFNPIRDHWIPRTMITGQVLFPSDTPLTFDEDGEDFMVRDFLNGSQMYSLIRNEKTARTLGWRTKNMWEYMARCSGSVKSSSSSTAGQNLERLYRQGDRGASFKKRTGGWLYSVYVKEYSDEDDKAISLYIIGDEDVEEKGEPDGYLFKKRYHLEEWPLFLFPYGMADTLADLRGIGQKTKDFFELENRLFNAAADQVFVGGTMPLRQTGTNLDPDSLRLMKMGLFSIVPQGLEPMPGLQQMPSLQTGSLALHERLRQANLENNQTYLMKEPERQDRQTGMEYFARSQNISQISKGSHNLHYRASGRWYRHMLVTALKTQSGNSLSARLARNFQEALKRQNVPVEEIRDKIMEVHAVRSVGAGSAAARVNALMMLFQWVYPNAPEWKKIALENDLAAALTTFSQANRYARSIEDQPLANSDDSLATAENFILTHGGKAEAGSEQDHVHHAGVHLQAGNETKDAVEQEQMDPQQGLSALIPILAHSGEHIGFLENNPLKKKEFAALEKEYNLLAQFTKHLQATLQQQHEAEAMHGSPEQKMSEEGQIKMMAAQADSKRKDWIAEQKAARDTRKLLFHEKVTDFKTAHSIARENAASVARSNRGTNPLALNGSGR